MRSRPLPVIIVALLFIVAGSVGFVYYFKEFFEPNARLFEIGWVQFVRIIAIVCGIFLFLGVNWARWLAIAWLLYHVYLSTLHSTTEVIFHIVILLVVAVLLYLPISSAFFRNKTGRGNGPLSY